MHVVALFALAKIQSFSLYLEIITRLDVVGQIQVNIAMDNWVEISKLNTAPCWVPQHSNQSKVTADV